MKIEDRPIVHEQQNIIKEEETMSMEQQKAHLEPKEAKKDIVEKAKEAGFEVSEEDLAGVSGGGFFDTAEDVFLYYDYISVFDENGNIIGYKPPQE